MDIWRKYREGKIDLSWAGFFRGDGRPRYFCTPRGAKVLGWAGVDGIHFCRIRGFGEAVFSVNPSNGPGEYVHPAAKCFDDFLRLLLCCGNTAAVEQAWRWDRAQFARFLEENPLSEEYQRERERLEKALKLPPLPDPYGYLRALEESFDPKRVVYAEEAETSPPRKEERQWRVYFEGNFWGPSGRERPGKELPVCREAHWGGYSVKIPSVYACGKGLVVDLCLSAPKEELRAFAAKWGLFPGEAGRTFTRAEQMRMEAENPLDPSLRLTARLNGRELCCSHSCAMSWNPAVPDGCTPGGEAELALKYYGLDRAQGWVVRRFCFPWSSKRRPKELREMELCLGQEPFPLPGEEFTAPAPGGAVPLHHPVTGEEYLLTVREYEAQTMPQRAFGRGGWVYPSHFVSMTYTISPEPEKGAFYLTECSEGDRPYRKQAPAPGPEEACAVSVGIIGSAGGAVVLPGGDAGPKQLHGAASALYFERPGEIRWLPVFRWRDKAEMMVRLSLK